MQRHLRIEYLFSLFILFYFVLADFLYFEVSEWGLITIIVDFGMPDGEGGELGGLGRQEGVLRCTVVVLERALNR